LGILPPDAAHIKTAGLFIRYIGHGSKVMRAGENSIKSDLPIRYNQNNTKTIKKIPNHSDYTVIEI
jgi:hypothetical protein